MTPQLIPYNEIDKEKWDACIRSSKNKLIYGYSFYLDCMTGNQWEALIKGDYEAVMPLPWRKKYGINYIYQPAFTQQLGVFSKANISPSVLQAFLLEMQKHYRFAEYNLNVQNIVSRDFELKSKQNFLVPLADSYKNISGNYLAGFTKSLRRLKKWELQYDKKGTLEEALKLYKKLYFSRTTVDDRDLDNFAKACSILQKKNNLLIRAVKLKEETIAISILLKDEKRIYNIISCITDNGKKHEANYFLYDKIIEEFSGSDYIFDLEGSDITGIADFYKKMNPIKETYTFLKYNHLPALVKLFKL